MTNLSHSTSLRTLAGLVCVALLSAPACRTTNYAEKTDETVDVPDAWDGVDLEGPELAGWCSNFDAPTLDKLVDRVFTDNLTMRNSWARLRQAKAAARQAAGARWPRASAEASVSRTPFPSLPEGVEVNELQYKLSAAASYEVDLWGRLANRHQAAKLDAAAARADAEAMAITLSSRVAELWVNLVYQRSLEDLLREQLETSRKFLKLTRLQFSKGSTNALDITQQQQQVESIEGRLETIEAQQKVLENQLAVLVGEPPQKEVTSTRAELPNLPPRPDPGIPGDLLEQRPDVQAAYLRLKAADKRTAAAAKAILPSISLSVSPFFQASSLASLFENLLLQGTAALSQTLFQGGAQLAEIEASEARAQAQLYNWGQTLLDAMEEVQSALVRETQQAKFIESLRDQLDTAEKSLRLARERYRNGAATYFRVLTALQSVQSAQQNLLDARRQQLGNRLTLCRALGGGGDWTEDLEPPSDDSSDS